MTVRLGRGVSGVLIMIFGVGTIIVGCWMYFREVGYFLQEGQWIPLPLFDSLANQRSGEAYALLNLTPPRLEAKVNWLAYPTSWLGLHQLVSGPLKFLSEPFSCICVGGLFMLVGNSKTEPYAEAPADKS